MAGRHPPHRRRVAQIGGSGPHSCLQAAPRRRMVATTPAQTAHWRQKWGLHTAPPRSRQARKGDGVPMVYHKSCGRDPAVASLSLPGYCLTSAGTDVKAALALNRKPSTLIWPGAAVVNPTVTAASVVAAA